MSFAPGFSSRFQVTRAIAIAISVALGGAAAGASEKVLYSFKGGSDGASPFGSLLADGAGNFYGTTSIGGGGTKCAGGQGCGTVFEISSGKAETVIYAFTGGNDGDHPSGSLVVDAAGNFYGTTSEGGAGFGGTVFKLAPGGLETVLHAFTGGADGDGPVGSVIFDASGNLYGTTYFGGNGTACGDVGCGTVFRIAPDGTETVLHAFQAGSDGAEPFAGLVADGAGNFYGTTAGGGGGNCVLGCGTVFRITPDGTETVSYAFQGGADGTGPGALMMDTAGNLYGTTVGGGTGCDGTGCGTVFKLAPDGTETVLYAFKGGSDGEFPEAGLVMDKKRNLYGATEFGGGAGCHGHGGGCGVVFKLTPDGKETVLETFGAKQGRYPAAALLMGKKGTLYGTTTAGGGKRNDGVVFSVTTK